MASALSFALNLIDGMSNPAHAGAEAIRGVSSSLKDARRELSSYQAQLGRAKKLGDLEGVERYTGLAADARRAVYGLTEQNIEAQASFGGLAGVLGPVSTGLMVIAGAAIAVGAGLAELTYKALELAESETEAREQAIILFDALGDGSDGAGQRTLSMISDLETRIPQTRKQLVGWTKELEALGITDLGEIRGQLQALASAQAMMGDEGAEKYLTLTRRIQEAADTTGKLKIADRQLAQLGLTGANVNDVAKELGITTQALQQQLKKGTANAAEFGAAFESAVLKKGIGPLGHMNTELSTVWTKGVEGFKHLFDSIDFNPLASQLHWLFSLFDEGPDHGNTFKEGITGALNSIVKGLAIFAEEAEHDFLQVEIFALENKKALDDLWTGVKVAGGIALQVVAEMAREMGNFVRYTLKAVEVAEDLAGLAGKLPGQHGSEETGGNGIQRMGAGGGVTRTGPGFAPANAEGGMVGRPAPGEFFASVAPGERIVPKDAGPANDNSGTTIHQLHVHIDAPAGVTDATHMTAASLAIVLERFQLGQGR